MGYQPVPRNATDARLGVMLGLTGCGGIILWARGRHRDSHLVQLLDHFQNVIEVGLDEDRFPATGNATLV